MSRPVRAALEEEGGLLRLVLDRPKGNVLDREMLEALREEARAAGPAVKALLLEGEGRHFSFGASVDEHRPEVVGALLPAFHGLFLDLAASGKVLLAAVRGQCLGGGLEVAAFCQRLVAAPDATLGQPEVKLGVFAPVASLVLPLRLGQARADDLLLTGRSVGAAEALALGLVDEVAPDPAEAARAWYRQHLAPRSAAGLRHAVLAARHRLHRALTDDLPWLERQYLEELMSTADAREGISAFLEKRAPAWSHR
ncbi:MAG: enoyl-CoA hydratase-related protein [Planctomycetes bacterium]|nr:enoyl-CoA hydratase-related protein [Planctomycetota bacterium]